MPSAVRFTDWISLASIAAVNCWAIISRPLRGLVELLFMQGKGKLLVCDSGFAAVQRRCSRDPGTLIRLCVADARSDGASFFWRHERSPATAEVLSVILGLFGGAKPRNSLRKQSHFGRHAGNFMTICVGKYFGCSSTVGRFIQIVIERDPDILEQVLKVPTL
jgi:hypothetical protein